MCIRCTIKSGFLAQYIYMPTSFSKFENNGASEQQYMLVEGLSKLIGHSI